MPLVYYHLINTLPPVLADTVVMGGAVSAGSSNEELVDNLCYEGYINEPSIEKVCSYE